MPIFLLWRCLHGGPLGPAEIDQPPEHEGICWPACRARNLPLLRRLTAVYGACAMLAWEGERVVGSLRFYPRAIVGQAGFCLQQDPPHGPAAELAETPLPPLGELADRTLRVHCLMLAPGAEAATRRRGLGTALARALIAWAHERGWAAIEATAYQDLDLIYALTGQAGRRFWERLGFAVAAEDGEPAFAEDNDWSRTLRAQAQAQGLDPECVSRRYTMRLDLFSPRMGRGGAPEIGRRDS
jgi:GNAT superfamily N-acetyltransferase